MMTETKTATAPAIAPAAAAAKNNLLAALLWREYSRSGGATIDTKTAQLLTTDNSRGFLASYSAPTLAIPAELFADKNAAILREFLATAAGAPLVGIWLDSETGIVHIDTSRLFSADEKRELDAFLCENNQIAAFCLDDGCEYRPTNSADDGCEYSLDSDTLAEFDEVLAEFGL